jgi:YDG domain
VISGDIVTLSQSGTFSDKNVGIGKTVTESFSISGADVSNLRARQFHRLHYR